MAELKTDALVKSVEALVAQKEAVTSRERELIEGLNVVLAKMGYRVVAADAVPRRRGRPPGSATKRSGRLADTVNGRRRKRGPGRPPKHTKGRTGSTKTKRDGKTES
jgi:hypothetical protein